MATRRSGRKGTPKTPTAKPGWVAAYRAEQAKREAYNARRRSHRRLSREEEVTVERTPRRRITTVRLSGERNTVLNQAKDLLSRARPEGGVYLRITPEGQNPFSTQMRPEWQEAYMDVDGRALDYLSHQRDVAANEQTTIEVVIIENYRRRTR